MRKYLFTWLCLGMSVASAFAQVLKEGTYFIKYNGEYLTNQTENVAGSVPQFVASLNEAKPKSQQWSITVDATTNRYKIINELDGRYLNEKGQFTVNDATNPYEAAWHTYYILRLANGKYCIQNAGEAGNKFMTVSDARVQQSSSTTLEPANFLFDLVPVDAAVPAAPIPTTRDVYYIMDGERYLTNTNPGGSGGNPTFTAVEAPGEAQEWRFIMDPSGKRHYMIASNVDGRYVNENGVFGVNAYFSDWNSYLILTKDGMCSVQLTQTAAQKVGAYFWNIQGDRLVIDKSLERSSSYLVKVVPKGEVTDFTEPEFGTLKQYTENGCIDGVGNTALPMYVTPLLPLEVVLRGAPGYAAAGLTIRYGHHLDGPEFDGDGTRQWTEAYIAAEQGRVVIDGAMMEADVALYATFEPEADSEWLLVFSDEFDGDDKSQPSDDKWIRCPRQNATWNRWLSDSEEVIYIEDGDLVARAIPNPDQAADPVPMITGGIKSMGKFGFTYGYVEARILSNAWRGHFPAFWMMPEDQKDGWPDCGEIDIWEAIDTDGRSYHTVHSNWTYDLKMKNDPQSSFNTTVPYDRYHTYGLAWDASTLIWYVDGKEVGRYAKSTDQSRLDKGQWPFDKHFHLMLNQSVGNGSWAANADVNHTYETRFDWVRVYQKPGMYNTAGQVSDIEELTHPSPANESIYTLQGVRLEGPVESLPKGVYIIGTKKVYVK